MMDEPITVGVSNRFFSRHVGGNSTYASNLYKRISTYGVHAYVHPLILGRSSHSALRWVGQMWDEGVRGPRSGWSPQSDVLHYIADTGPLLRGRLPIVATIHGVASRHVRGVRNPLAAKLWRARTARCAETVDRIITVSESSKTDIIEEFAIPTEKISVIHHGYDDRVFNPAPTDADRHLATLELPAKFVLYIGNIEPRKNIAALVDAVESVSRELDLSLVIAGRPAWDARPILERISSSNVTRYLGPVDADTVPALMRRCALFAFPSHYEGFGLPVLEAQACGAAVVTSRNGSLPEVAGDGARFIDSVCADGIAEGIRAVASSEEYTEQLRRTGLANANRFMWAASAERHAAVLREVVNSR